MQSVLAPRVGTSASLLSAPCFFLPEGLSDVGRQLWRSLTSKRGPHFPGTRTRLCEWSILKSHSDLQISNLTVTEKQNKGAKPDSYSQPVSGCYLLVWTLRPVASASQVRRIATGQLFRGQLARQTGLSMRKLCAERKILRTQHKQELATGFSLKDKTQQWTASDFSFIFLKNGFCEKPGFNFITSAFPLSPMSS